jgi:TRAP-type C4-dicarboxylate transport system permease large subunit
MELFLIVALGCIIGFLLIGTPVAFALGSAASVMVLVFASPIHLEQFASIAYTQATSANQLVAPLFVLMAEFLAQGGIASDIFTILNDKMRKFRAGLAMSATLASTVFAAMCGSSSATAAAIGRISIAEMIKKGYRSDFTVGVVMSGGTLGIMIPPSLTFVFYGIITETSIAKLLMAGLIPGLMISVFLCIFIFIRSKINPALVGVGPKTITEELTPEMRTSFNAESTLSIGKDSKGKLPDSWVLRIGAPALLILAVLGSMYTGLATPNECAGIGAIGAFIIVLLLRRCTKPMFFGSLSAAARTSAMILFLAICGFGLTYVVAYLGIASQLATVIAASGLNKWAVLILVYLLWLVLGCLMDPGSMVVLTIPFLLSSLNQLGFDTIWLGVVSTLMVEVGMLTPPVGLNLFVIKTISGLPFSTLMRGISPFLLVFVVALVLLTLFPEIALFLPNHM